MTILYEIDSHLYVNITNKCPCACTFCIRLEQDGIYGSDSLWLEHEPSLKEITDAFKKIDLKNYKSIVFCGYGEPLERLDILLEVCRMIRPISDIPIRVNTNGLANLIHKRSIVSELKGWIDEISISLNAPNEKRYLEITRSCFGKGSFESLIGFIRECKKEIGKVVLSVVDVLTEEEINECVQLADSLEIPLRIRKKMD